MERHGLSDKFESVADFINWGRGWMDKRRSEGWQDTPDGLMSMDSVREAGYKKSKTSGRWEIPLDYVISSGAGDRTIGSKYLAPSSKYLTWRESRGNKRDIDKQIDDAMSAIKKPSADLPIKVGLQQNILENIKKGLDEQYDTKDKNGEIIVDNIPF